LVVIAAARGDAGSPFGHALDATLTPAQAAKLPWRQNYVSGSAGPLDARGLPSAAAQRAAVAHFYRLGLPLYCAGGGGNYAALTFDDGPSPFSEQVLGLLPVLWDVDTRDSLGADTPQIVTNAEQGLRPGAIVLMHETYTRSLAAVPQVLASARKKGLRLVTVSQLLALDPPPDSLVRA